MTNLVSRDIQTTTGENLILVEMSSGLSAWDAGQDKLMDALKMEETLTLEDDNKCRIPFLSKLLGQMQELAYLGEEVEEISNLINSLCINLIIHGVLSHMNTDWIYI